MPMVVMTSSGSSEVLQALGAPVFVRGKLDLALATAPDGVLDLLRERKVEVVLLDAGTPGIDAPALARSIRAEPACASSAVVLVLRAPVDGALLGAALSSGSSDLLLWPLPEDEFYEHMSQFLPLPRRRSHRVEVQIPRALLRFSDGRQLPAEVLNLSTGGLCVVTGAAPGPGAEVVIQLGQAATEEIVEAPARVAWRTDTPAGIQLGLQLHDVRPAVRRLLETLTLWDVRELADGTREVALEGEIDERASFERLSERLALPGPLVFDLGGITRMNSMGVRRWCGFVEALADRDLVFRRCSVAFAAQMSMIPAVLGPASVTSVRAPYHCARCEVEVERLLPVVVIRTEAALESPRFHCTCGGQLVLDDLPERYFAFLR